MMKRNVLGDSNNQWYFCLYRFLNSGCGLRRGYVHSSCIRLQILLGLAFPGSQYLNIFIRDDHLCMIYVQHALLGTLVVQDVYHVSPV